MAQTFSKLTTLRNFVAKQPEDPFPRYGLAMELKNLGQVEEAWEQFSQLIQTSPQYLASYAPCGDLLTSLGRNDEAKAIYTKGISIATQQGNHHIKDLLNEALDNLSPK